MTVPNRPKPDLFQLIGLFYQGPEQLGEFTEVDQQELPAVYRRLLAHNDHMTVTVEDFHGSPVSVHVLKTHITDTHYARKILLRRQSDGQVVQFGIARLNLMFLSEPVRQEVESQRTPLGRILIEHNVLRKVELVSLWRIQPAAELCEFFQLTQPQPLFGRTALIYCEGEPAVELLEIVTPVE